MNRLTVEQLRENRRLYDAYNRTDGDVQRIYRELLDDLGYDLDGMAVLHGPDQVAGGFPHRFDGPGDSGVNSSLGSQWRTRIGELIKDIDAGVELAEIPDDLLKYIRINVQLT